MAIRSSRADADKPCHFGKGETGWAKFGNELKGGAHHGLGQVAMVIASFVLALARAGSVA